MAMLTLAFCRQSPAYISSVLNWLDYKSQVKKKKEESTDLFIYSGTPKTIIIAEPEKPVAYGAALNYPVEKYHQVSIIFNPKKSKGGIKIDVRGIQFKFLSHITNCLRFGWRKNYIFYG